MLLWAIQCLGAILGDAAAFSSAGARVGFAVGKVSDLGNRIDGFGIKRGLGVRESAGLPVGVRLCTLPAARCLIQHGPGALRASTASAPSTTASDGVGVDEAPWMERLKAESERLDRRLYQVLHTNRRIGHWGTQISSIFRGRDGVCCSQSPHRCGFSSDDAKPNTNTHPLSSFALPRVQAPYGKDSKLIENPDVVTIAPAALTILSSASHRLLRCASFLHHSAQHLQQTSSDKPLEGWQHPLSTVCRCTA